MPRFGSIITAVVVVQSGECRAIPVLFDPVILLSRIRCIADEQHHFGPRRPLGDEQLSRAVTRQTSSALGGARRLGSSAVDREDTRRPVHGVRSQRQSEKASKIALRNVRP